jgi:excisionase family DNA binding protein
MPELISQSEAAALLGKSESQVARLRASGRLAFVKLDNGSIRLHRAHVMALAPRRAAPAPVMSAHARELPTAYTREPSRRAVA